MMINHWAGAESGLYAKDDCLALWDCQFEKPTTKALIGEMEPGARALVIDLRRSIAGLMGKKPKLEWLGETWRWCETTSGAQGRMLLGVHLVADPANPRLALSISTGFFEKHPPASLPSELYSGLSDATCVGHLSWCEWALNSQETADAILRVIELSR